MNPEYICKYFVGPTVTQLQYRQSLIVLHGQKKEYEKKAIWALQGGEGESGVCT